MVQIMPSDSSVQFRCTRQSSFRSKGLQQFIAHILTRASLLPEHPAAPGNDDKRDNNNHGSSNLTTATAMRNRNYNENRDDNSTLAVTSMPVSSKSSTMHFQSNLAELAQRFESSFDRLNLLLEAEPCLIDDFQVFLTADGRIVHLDTDRCFMAIEHNLLQQTQRRDSCRGQIQYLRDWLQSKLLNTI